MRRIRLIARGSVESKGMMLNYIFFFVILIEERLKKANFFVVLKLY